MEENQLLRLVEHLELGDDPQVQNLIHVIDSTSSQKKRQKAKQILRRLVLEKLDYPFTEDLPDNSFLDDVLVLGKTYRTGKPYTLHRDELTEHLLAVGQTGAGKTTFFYQLMMQLRVPFWAFDLKQDYRHLIKKRDDILVLPVKKLRFNPLKPPPQVDPGNWVQRFSEIFCDATDLLTGSQNYLKRNLDELFHQRGIYGAEDVSRFPAMHDLQALIEENTVNYMRQQSDYRERVLNRLEAINSEVFTTFECSSGYSLEELLSRNVVFELDGLSDDTQNFLMEVLMASVYMYRKAGEQRGGQLRHVFFLDEGKRLFSVYKERQDASGMPVIDELVAKMREFGEGLVVADQEASKLTDSIKANTKSKLLLATGDAEEFDSFASSMKLDKIQRNWAKQLDVGTGVFQCGSLDPEALKLPEFQLEKDIGDDELAERMSDEWQSLSFEPWEEGSNAPVFDGEEPAEQPVQTGEEQTTGGDEPGEPVSEVGEKLLERVAEDARRKLTDLYKGFSRYRGSKAKNELVEKGLVQERVVDKKYGQPTLLELTENGEDYVENCLDLEVKRRGRGGVVHRYWQKLLDQSFSEAGFSTEIEVDGADLVAVNEEEEERIAVEVAMEVDQREADHVEDRLDIGFDRVVVGCRSQSVKEGIQELLEEQGLADEYVDVRLLQDLQEVERKDL